MSLRKRGRSEADWTFGLKTRTANALRAHGFRSKDEVAAASLENLLSVEHFGKVSLDDLRAWLLADTEAQAHRAQQPATRISES